ncbi:nicotinate phosphoribosyltransferase [Oenococcus oeni]|uniref:Nicotinamide phosphoribosyltransferase n=1 Tax=Oenococcus oeni ATCC BAA-1163 TaxID=379360 RepID=A0NK16_OENOE|nr:nicotinate phosphoribosyltransferase [Oenococcus oeni]EAV39155.1 nicotinate phosphoribosyltransferase [Oenococcus oeni ATCC BAA-1163]EJN99342.1 nicotinate phosphoribosyltransferase [Oenococcus oeni AWRIB418]KDE87769.1 nicotinate phosphoribosyltransferase [Oenococcus oeni]KEP88217.1 nicotinate phosphoribosyltransferase [Oenococcus oeni IOEB_0501]KGH66604.1 nicotinate phosphoribosyltransferase [Oenococcus oeni IOEB_C23]
MKENLLLDTDAYKLTHHLQYPKGLTKLYSYAEARPGSRFNTVSWFGLQMIIADHLLGKVTNEMIDEAEEFSFLTFGNHNFFNREVWERVRDLGYLPINIMELPEGIEVPISTPLLTLESTEPWFATTLNALESVLMQVWYPTTISTNSMYIKKALLPLFEKSGSVAGLDLAVNDFGLRGASSLQSAQRGGAAHLLHFRGSDNLAADKVIADVYGLKGRALSVWATEHSVATSYGPDRGEIDYVNSQLDRAGDNDIISIVIDSYDSINFVRNVIGSKEIKNRIIRRSGRIVLRPDSGEPQEIDLQVLDILADIFGTDVNDKGYKVINHNVGIIQGDGMNRQTIIELYRHILHQGWSADNLIVGSGGGLLQEGFDRDTERFAIKASYGELGDGHGFLIQKHPKQDPTKNSKSGRFKVIRDSNRRIKTVAIDAEGNNLLKTIYENGNFYPDSFQEILKRANISLD